MTMSFFTKVRLFISYLLLIVKSIAFGFFFVAWGIFFFLHTNYIKSRAVNTFERTLKEEGLPPGVACELRNSYDFKWRDLVRRW
jgi:hypothetical protein